MGLPCSKGEHLASWGGGLAATTFVIWSHFFCKYWHFFFVSTVMLRCMRGIFGNFTPGDLKWCFLPGLTVPVQKTRGISLPCQRGKPDELRRLSLILTYCLTVCSNQQGKQQRRSSWSHARMLFFWRPFAAAARDLFASLCSRAVSR